MVTGDGDQGSGYRVYVGDDHKLWHNDSGSHIKHCECTSCHQIIYLQIVKMINIMFCIFCHEKGVK